MNPQRHPVRVVLRVWLALLLLLALTLASACVDLGAGNMIANLVIAAVKVALVAVFFMHLRRADATVRLAAGAALLFLFFLAFLTFGDYLTRPMHPAPWRSPQESTLTSATPERTGDDIESCAVRRFHPPALRGIHPLLRQRAAGSIRA